MNYNLISNILGGKWLIDPTFAQANLGLIISVLKGGGAPEADKEKFNHLAASSGALISAYQDYGFKNQEIPDNSIAMIPVQGAIMKSSGMCSTGTMEMATWVRQANDNPKISTILFMVDSPGGMVDGTSTLGDAIKSASKKTVAYIEDGMAASAGYWIASSCDEIWSSHSINLVGSIGVYVTMADWKKYYEKEGLILHEVYSTLSTEKNKDFHEALKGNYKMLQDGMLDPIAENFIAHVKASRGDKLNLKVADPFKGGIYTSDKALEMGLIDRIGSLNELMGEIAAAQSNSNQFSQSNKNQMSLKKWIASRNAGSDNGEEKVTIDASELNLLRTDMEAAQNELDAANVSNQQLTADLALANSATETAEASVVTLTTENTELKAKVTQYGAQPGATHEVPKKGTEDLGEEAEEEITATDAEVKEMRKSLNFI